MRDHTKLKAFELADKIALMIYKITKDFPQEELYCLTSQMRRAAISVPSNIVEGCARNSMADYVKFLEYAFGSLKELSYQFSLAGRLGYIANKTINDCDLQLIEAEKVLASLIRKLRNMK